MTNKYLTEEDNKALKERLSKLASKLVAASSPGELQTREQIISETMRILSSFYKDLSEPSFDYLSFYVHQIPLFNDYNQIFNLIEDDLSVSFAELENLELVSLANFNFATTETNRLLARLKAVYSKLNDYILYASHPTKDVSFFVDTFNNILKIDVGSSLLNAEQGNINQEEGIVTLPIDISKTKLIAIKESPIINSNSNGIAGNNQQLNAVHHGSLIDILDNNPDTWFEYERVVSAASDDQQELILDFTINIGEEKIINHIRINPNNFGTKKSVRVERIEISVDGQFYTDIQQYMVGDAQSFVLAPSTSKFAGQGLYTFIPRKVKYIHIVLSQSEPYLIDTASGQKLRYAIGIRDVAIYSVIFKNKGEFISKPFDSAVEIRKIILDVNQNIKEDSKLASIKYSISHDDGQSWRQIRPKSFLGASRETATVPEILSYNNANPVAITTHAPVKTIRFKAMLERNDDAFATEAGDVNKIQISRSELHAVPVAAPFSFQLDKIPLVETIDVIDPLFGSRGLKKVQYVFPSQNAQTFYLPFEGLRRPVKKVLYCSAYHIAPVEASEWAHVSVAGEEWAHSTQSLASYSAGGSVDEQYRLYYLSLVESILHFGNGQDTMAPPTDSIIGVYFDAEELFPSELEDNHVARLNFKTGNDKSQVAIKKYRPIEIASEAIPKNTTVIHLQNKNIQNTTGISCKLGDGNEKTFLNGKDELVTTGDWSIDTDEGVIYLKDPVTSSNHIISYTHQKIDTLAQEDWDWERSDVFNSIVIKESGWETFERREQNILMVNNATSFDLQDLKVVRGTLVLTLTGLTDIDDSDNPFIKEVSFIDGKVELGADILKKLEIIATLTPTGGIASFSLTENITNDSDYVVVFSNTDIFITEQSALPLSSAGDYYIDRNPSSPTYRTVYVKTASSVNIPGEVLYYYANTNYDNSGLYSVDYEYGRVYTQRPMNSTWTLKATYQYTDYRAEYPIARSLSSSVYVVDSATGTITVKDAEILKRKIFPGLATQYYQVNYDYVDSASGELKDLQEYFTPVLRDYTMKVLTKDNVF